MTTAFQADAFQQDSFEIDASVDAPAGGKGDNQSGKRSKQSQRGLFLPFKPTGLIDRPVRTSVDVRFEESREIHEEVSRQSALEFLLEASPPEVHPPTLQFAPIKSMTLSEIDAEIGARLRKKMLDDEDEAMLLILIAENA